MEVPFTCPFPLLNEREEEEVMGIGTGMDLETTSREERSPHKFTDKLRPDPTSAIIDTNICVSNQSSRDNNGDYFANLDTHTHTHTHNNITTTSTTTTTITNAAHIHNLHFEDIHVSVNQGTPGFSVHQNGSNGVYSLPESNGGYKEIDVVPNASTSSKSPNTAIGRGYLESLLDDNSNNVIPTTSFNAENEILSHNEELEPQVEEYDVERVIQKQETHDLYCPNCHSCITKRVILRRRKRKIHEISTAEEASGTALDQSSGLPAFSDDIAEETQQAQQVGGAPDSRLDAISCFSCFSIFVPSGEGFLCWRFKPKADATRQPVVTSTGHGQAEESTTDDSTGTVFPLWVVTCCQPAERKKPDETTVTPGSIYVPIPEDDTEVPSREAERPLPLSDDTLSSETPSNITTDEGSNFPLWILTCCQPSMVGKKMDHPVKLDKSESAQENPPASSGGTNPDHPVKPGGTAAQRETPMPPSDSTEFDHLAKSDGTVPQRDTPSAPSDFPKFGHLEKSDGIVPQKETPSGPSDFTQSYHVAKPDGTLLQKETLSAPSSGTRPPLAPSDDIPIPPFRPTLPAIYIPGTSPQSKPITPVEPSDGIPLPPQTESSTSPGNGVLSMPPKPQLPVMPSNTHGAELLVDVEPGVARGTRRPGVSGLDVIKAIVYGGLLESITSLSVITSAAGGEATTLNIVALGLANVLGGLVVLVHSLRVLKHEHTTEHYEAQLGRPGHYMFHAVVAILSYLVFGLMSPVIYGFSFRKSDNKDYKLATLAGAALACITILSVGKAYVRNPPKGYIKTVFYYICLAFMVSGLGYVAGDVINTLLKKFGIFDPRAPDTVGVLAAGVMNGGWSSY